MTTSTLRSVALALGLACAVATQTASVPARGGQRATPELSGVWSGIYTTPALDGWRVEDFYCPVGCSAATYAQLHALLADAASRNIAFDALVERAEAATLGLAALLTPAAELRHRAFERRDDPSIRCEPKGLAREVLNPLPMEIEQQADRVTIRYEQWQALRTIRLGPAQDAPTAASLLGDSTGYYEDGVFVVETGNIAANILTSDGIPHSDALHAVERYVLTDGGSRLELELTLHDPEMFLTPIVMTKAWLRTPDERVLEERCEVISGRP